VFRGTRVPFQALLDYLEGGETLDEFLDDFPAVTREAAITALDRCVKELRLHVRTQTCFLGFLAAGIGYSRSVDSRHPKAAPTARLTSIQRSGTSSPARLVSETRATIRRLSQLATQAFGRPSSSPRGTSLAICRMVDVISAATSLLGKIAVRFVSAQ
jgi:hypothetical protein